MGAFIDQLREANDRYVRALEEQARTLRAQTERLREEERKTIQRHNFAMTLSALDPLGRTAKEWQERAALADDPLEYLGRRLKEVAVRVAWVNDLSSARRRGIDRFSPGLDSALDVVREQRRAKGGLDGNDEAELGWAPRDERKRKD